MFYEEYFKRDVKEATEYKIKFLQSILKDNCIYKFIAFDDNDALNEIKLQCLQKDQLWFSYFRYLNDPTEFDITCNKKNVSKKLKKPEEHIEKFLKLIIEIYDVCSFTYQYNDYMWEEYANNGSGICLEFEVGNLDMLYPVEYKIKDEIDFDEMIIKSFTSFNQLSKNKDGKLYNDQLSLYPWVVKNPLNGYLDSAKEKEIRILYSPYDYREFNNGIINGDIKEIKDFHGLNVNYEQLDLSLKKIIIGSKCNATLMDKLHKVGIKKGVDLVFQDA